jgi:hypothetical protein
MLFVYSGQALVYSQEKKNNNTYIIFPAKLRKNIHKYRLCENQSKEKISKEKYNNDLL